MFKFKLTNNLLNQGYDKEKLENIMSEYLIIFLEPSPPLCLDPDLSRLSARELEALIFDQNSQKLSDVTILNLTISTDIFGGVE